MDEFKFDPYKILDLPKNSSDNEIKRRYRKLVKKYHPDKCKDDNKDSSTKIFEAIEKAYHLLISSDPTKKYKVELSFNELKQEFNENIDKNNKKEKPKNNPVKTIDKNNLKIKENNYDKELINKLQKIRDDELLKIQPILNNNNFEQSIFNQLFDYNKKKYNEIIEYKKPIKCFSQSSAINNINYTDLSYYDDNINNPDPTSININNFTQNNKNIIVNKMDCNTFEKEINKHKCNLKKHLFISSDVYEVNDNKFFDLW